MTFSNRKNLLRPRVFEKKSDFRIQGCPQVLHDLMVDCWNHKAEDRPTFKQLDAILHNYLTNPSLLDDLPRR